GRPEVGIVLVEAAAGRVEREDGLIAFHGVCSLKGFIGSSVHRGACCVMRQARVVLPWSRDSGGGGVGVSCSAVRRPRVCRLAGTGERTDEVPVCPGPRLLGLGWTRRFRRRPPTRRSRE